MKKLFRGVAVCLLTLLMTACVTQNRIPDEHRTDLFYGEAIYFQSRCSQYKSVDFKRAVFAYCLANKAYNSGCSAKAAARNFLKGSAEGLNAAKAKYTAMSDKQVCKIAESRFGKNGTVYKNMLQR